MIWYPSMASEARPSTGTDAPIVVIQLTRAVMLSVAGGISVDGSHARLEILADAHPIGHFDATLGTAPLLAVLLSGPAWLTFVASELRSDLLGKLWALVPADPDSAAQGDLHEEYAVYGVPLREIVRSPDERHHPGDLAAEARHVLQGLLSVRPSAS